MGNHLLAKAENSVHMFPKGWVETLCPYSQEEILDHLVKSSPRGCELSSLFRKATILRRHSVFPRLFESKKTNGDALPLDELLNLSTAERNNLYRKYAPSIFYNAARSLLDDMPELQLKEITHVITASCTGCYSPGPSEELVISLGLRSSTERLHVGYMGCFAGLAALRIANSICQSSKDAVVLIVCAEISSLHWRDDMGDDNKVSLSLFSDGAAGAIVSRRFFRRGLVVDSVGSDLIADSAGEMAWNMGERGFEMRLSRKVPLQIRDSIPLALDNFLERSKTTVSQLQHWAVHPGGKKILETIEALFAIDPEQICSSYDILRDYGNMSSTTIFFVLEQILSSAVPGDSILALAFGPGISIEQALLHVQE